MITELIRSQCLLRGDFTLSSGAKSPYYLDLRRLTLSQHLGDLCREVWHAIPVGSEANAFAGMETGANALVAGMACLLKMDPRTYHFGIVRKEAKVHGAGGRTYGSLKKGDRVILLEDVATTGASMAKAVEALTEFSCHTLLAIAIVDREEGAKSLLAQMDVPLITLTTLKEVLA